MKNINFLSLVILSVLSSLYGMEEMEELICTKKIQSDTISSGQVPIKFNPKSCKTICNEKIVQAIKKSVDPKNHLEQLSEIKKQIDFVKGMSNVCLIEQLEGLLYENVQPVWQRQRRLQTINNDKIVLSEKLVFDTTTLAWLDDNNLHYMHTTKPKLAHSYELSDANDDWNWCHVQITPDQRYIAATHVTQLFMLDTQTGDENKYLAPGYITALTFASDSLGAFGVHGGACCFIKKNEKDLYTLTAACDYFSKPIRAVEFSSDSSLLVVSDGKNIGYSSNADNYTKLHVLTIPKLSEATTDRSIGALRLSPDASLLAINFQETYQTLIYSFVHNSSLWLPNRVIKIDHANRCIGATWTYKEEDEEDPEARCCHLDYCILDCIDNSYTGPSYCLPKDCCCSVAYQKSATINPLSVVLRQKGDDDRVELLVQKKVNLKKLLYLIAINKASIEELKELSQQPILKSFKEKYCGNVVKHFINYRLRQLQEGNYLDFYYKQLL